MLAKADEWTRRRANTSSLSRDAQAFAVSDVCVRISFIWASVSTLACFKAVSIALISSRCARRIVSSSLHSGVVMSFILA